MAKAYYDICPCKDCKKREAMCHATCVAYKKWKNNGAEIIEPFVDYKKKRRNRKR